MNNKYQVLNELFGFGSPDSVEDSSFGTLRKERTDSGVPLYVGYEPAQDYYIWVFNYKKIQDGHRLVYDDYKKTKSKSDKLIIKKAEEMIKEAISNKEDLAHALKYAKDCVLDIYYTDGAWPHAQRSFIFTDFENIRFIIGFSRSGNYTTVGYFDIFDLSGSARKSNLKQMNSFKGVKFLR